MDQAVRVELSWLRDRRSAGEIARAAHRHQPSVEQPRRLGLGKRRGPMGDGEVEAPWLQCRGRTALSSQVQCDRRVARREPWQARHQPAHGEVGRGIDTEARRVIRSEQHTRVVLDAPERFAD
jgi:hypothetical protein